MGAPQDPCLGHLCDREQRIDCPYIRQRPRKRGHKRARSRLASGKVFVTFEHGFEIAHVNCPREHLAGEHFTRDPFSIPRRGRDFCTQYRDRSPLLIGAGTFGCCSIASKSVCRRRRSRGQIGWASRSSTVADRTELAARIRLAGRPWLCVGMAPALISYLRRGSALTCSNYTPSRTPRHSLSTAHLARP
jgi:hypothetical protein